ncbi:protein phosphatase 2C 51 [Capsicum annuum]|uniref:protein phosphatase 2C 51 n=1 Tax=Capsicum annuum TaxID=4072 RepID=UPI001FB088DD|nr:protein phosphatase 2C 51 [Capsicum annuum]
MVSDDGNKNKPRNLFHRRVLKSYHKRQQIQQRMNTSTTTSSGEDGAAAAAYREDGDSVTEKRFRVRENEPIDKSSSNNSIITTTVESSSSSNNTNTTTVVEVLTESKELKYGFISMIGRRRVMEDAIKVGVRVRVRVMDNNEFMFFGVYDGHGGSRVSLACRERLHYIIEEELLELNRMDWEKVMMTSFSRMDEEVRGVGYEEDMGRTVGSSAMVVMVGKEVVVVANCGDCRTMLCNRGVTVPLSHDHKADRPDEKKRVEAAGGKILNWKGSRVQGVLATSRSIGDHCLKPFLIPEPEVTVYKRNEWDEFLVIGTNGLWDVVSNEVACEVVRKCLDGQIQRRFPERDSAADAAALLTELAIAKGSKDNISVIVVELDKISDIKV